MKRALSASKAKSAAPGAKPKPRRRLVVAKQASARAKSIPNPKSGPAAKRKLATKARRLAKPRTLAKSKSVAKSNLVAKRQTKPVRQPTGKPQSAVRRTPTRKSPVPRPRVEIPAYLLEGDVPLAATVTGPGKKFALGPQTPAAHFAPDAAYLPEAYGTGRLYVTPRDPHWLYAHWDIVPQEQFRHNARSVDRHLILRIHEGEVGARPVAEIHVHPESRHWFAHVERSATMYVAELGYYQTGRRWKSLATSAPAKAPADYVSTDATVEFATIPLELPFETLLGLLKERAPEALPLARAIEQLRRSRQSPLAKPPEMSEWTPEQERTLTEFLARERAAADWPSSHGISELAGGQTVGDIAPIPNGEFEWSSNFGGPGESSPFGGGSSGGNEFWLRVNAELIVYGATQPDARVTIDGKQVPLRPDGSFDIRFALPDGQYALPIVAVSADDTDVRAAELKFTRSTEFVGDVGEQPPDPAFEPPPQNG